MNATGPYWSLVSIGSGDGLVPSAITWTTVDQDMKRRMASLGPNKLTILPLDNLTRFNYNPGMDK